ncbi:hypothetical protein SERLA73DRAFT_183575 [Serpula lacrymans var. lacrymans S7.3]|uniref:Uncharacterized protein n=2 Tax=Serpula lacrymans var. lacrymans TaxID=341189 RepID=F8Q051_SERL3|nr:uncharacterized protein SERLADRAFT_470828 [Serpula lacrymans var. lacrymans S7.9]EGN98523.1 hypothetical protein SERLA73DRAFT_183575 [Serpula lacrymans var. lacrymans S7.3]EGO24093.1 hypothetical protein SERLADRAFT_470828 [Serpula lacrymans var. lacrymans S7.9]
MALNAPISQALSTSDADRESSPPQAGPLPLKRGEIGYREETTVPAEQQTAESSTSSPAPDSQASETAGSTSPPSSSAAPQTTSSTASSNTPSDHPCAKKLIASLFKSEKVPSYGGICLSTLLIFTLQFLIIAVTVVGWVLSVQHISTTNATMSVEGSSGQQSVLPSSTTVVYVHIIFAIMVLVQLIFLERRIFRMRAERFVHLHPGAILPTSRNFSSSSRNMGIVPWNRAPLPTYAAAIAQSGHGTGDVEDNIIAVPPPPAYGNTRGSRLLLAGYLRNSLRAQRPVSIRSNASELEERPHSYVSSDEEWEVIRNAEAARKLEETLSKEGDDDDSRVTSDIDATAVGTAV